MLISQSFYLRPTIEVAKDLIGKQLNFYGKTGIIIETEAYIGMDDPACHAAVGKTKRNAVMFGDAGYSYVYLIYGMYHCLNFVTEEKGKPAAVLIRGIKTEDALYDGPGKLCRYMGITREHNGLDIVDNKDFFVSDIGLKLEYKATPRIGISKGKEKLWRFVVI